MFRRSLTSSLAIPALFLGACTTNTLAPGETATVAPALASLSPSAGPPVSIRRDRAREPAPLKPANYFRTSGLYLMRWGWSASAPLRRLRSSMYAP